MESYILKGIILKGGFKNSVKMRTSGEVNKPYRISGLLGVDSYPTHAAAAVIWTPSAVSPCSTCIVWSHFHY